MKRLLSPALRVALALALCLSAAAAPPKTDLASEIFIEDSATDFTLTLSPVPSRSTKVQAFQMSGAPAGKYTVLCFMDGKIWSQQPLDLPGVCKLNVSGLTAGPHRVTLQAVNDAGKVGSASKTILAN